MPTPAPRLTLVGPNPPAMPDESGSRPPPLRGNLRASVGDGATYSVMLGLGEQNFTPFAVAVATGETLAGLCATIPMLVGSVVQLFAPAGLRRLGSHKWWIVGGSAVQAAALLLLPLAAFFTGLPAAVMILSAVSLYFAGVQSAGPAWNTWIEGIVPKRVRTRFFSCRARVSQMSSMVGFLIGGIALHWASIASGWHDRNSAAPHLVLFVFGGLFLAAAIARFMSVAFLASHRDPPGEIVERGPSFMDFFRGKTHRDGNRLVWCLLAMQVAVQISGPFFYPYLLQERNASYFSFLLLVTVCFLGKVIALPFWGRIAQRTGAARLFWLGGTAIVPISGLWIFADVFSGLHLNIPLRFGSYQDVWVLDGTLVYLCLVQMTSGVMWAAYELAMTLMFLEAIPRDERTTVLTYYNFGNSAAMMLGSLIGGTILFSLGESGTAYMVLFGLSSLARAGVMFTFTRLPQPTIEPAESQSAPIMRTPRLRLITADEVDAEEEELVAAASNTLEPVRSTAVG